MSKTDDIYFCGIDIGSSATKIVLLNCQGDILDMEAIQQGVGGDNEEEIMQCLRSRHPEICTGELVRVSTGYGRLRCKEAMFQKSEITCHAKGVTHLIPDVRTIIDIGGQDSKVIRVSGKGNIEEFVMNDKCAAGTGRFLDVMSHVLGVALSDMGGADAEADRIVKISNTCTVFAESEVISYLSQNEKVENVIAGIHSSVASKAASLAKRVSVTDKVVLTGGVAQNKGIVRALSEELKRKIIVPQIPQFTGALGAAIYAYEKFYEKSDL